MRVSLLRFRHARMARLHFADYGFEHRFAAPPPFCRPEAGCAGIQIEYLAGKIELRAAALICGVQP